MDYNVVQSLWADENFEWVSMESIGKSGGLSTMWDKSISKVEQSCKMECYLGVIERYWKCLLGTHLS